MQLWEEAPRTELFGIQVYSFGIYCAIGSLAAAAAILILCRSLSLRRGTGILLSLLSIVFGLAGSRLLYCLLHNPGGDMIPFYGWFRLSTGGYSLFGMIFGVFAAAACCAAVTGESRSALLDIASCAVPLLIAAERLGEKMFDGFDISRQLEKDSFPAGTFLAVQDPYYKDVFFLATWLVSAVCAIALFLILVFFLARKNRREGDAWILFLMLCGAGGAILESLRYDFHLEFSFVYFQQILAAVLLIWGVLLAARRGGRRSKGIARAAYISLPAAVAVCGGIEFALDRMSISHILLYAVMAAALAVPVTLGILLLQSREKGTKTIA